MSIRWAAGLSAEDVEFQFNSPVTSLLVLGRTRRFGGGLFTPVKPD